MPYELSRRNFKNAQRVIEHTSTALTTALSGSTKAASKPNADPDVTLDALDSMLSKMQTLKRKLEALHDEEQKIHRAAKARVQHLQDLYQVQSLVDVRYEEWSRTRLSRLLVDYLLREGYVESATHLAQSKGITELVDVEPFVACHKVERSLKEEMTTSLALEWCKEHSKELKKGGNMLEFELRLQQYIELVRQGHEAGLTGMDGLETEDGMHGVSIGGGGGEMKLVEARAHAKKYLSASGDFELLRRAAGLLAYRPWDEVEPYAVCSHLLHLYVESMRTNLSAVALLACSLDPSGHAVPDHTPQLIFATAPTAPPHRTLGRPLRPQDASLPFRVYIFLGQRIVIHNHRLSNLQHRAQRTRAQCSLCLAH